MRKKISEYADFLVVGSVNIDILLKQDRFAEIGETLHARDALIFPGGKGANQAVQIGKLGGRVSFVGAVGDDPFYETLKQSFIRNNVCIDDLMIKSGLSGMGIVHFLESGEVSATIVKGANYKIGKDDILQRANHIRHAKIVILQQEIPEESVETVIKIASEADTIVVLNAAPVRPLPEEYIYMLDYMVLNEVEASYYLNEKIIDIPDAIRCGRQYADIYKLNIVLTLGEKGSVLITENGEHIIPPIKVDVVETTGAGDSYIGTFSYMLNAGHDPLTACRYAGCSSAITIQAEGAQKSMPGVDEVIEMYDKIYNT